MLASGVKWTSESRLFVAFIGKFTAAPASPLALPGPACHLPAEKFNLLLDNDNYYYYNANVSGNNTGLESASKNLDF